jgi:hypothetical protein
VRVDLLISALVIGTAARMALATLAWGARGSEPFLLPDSQGYLLLASSLATRLRFESASGEPELFRTPGYPLALVPGSLAGHPILYALVVQVVLSAAIVVVTFLVAQKLTRSDRIAGWCAVATAIEPTLMLWSIQVMPETLLALCLLCFLWTAVHTLRDPHPGFAVLAAVFLTSAAYVKPVAYPLVWVMCTVALVYSVASQPKRVTRAVVMFTLTCALLLTVWHVRNGVRTGYGRFSTLFDHAIYISAGGSIAARADRIPFLEVRNRLYERVDAYSPSAPHRYELMRRDGWALVARHPFDYLQTHLQGIFRTLFDPGATDWLRLFGAYSRAGRLQAFINDGLYAGIRRLIDTNPAIVWLSLTLSPFVVALVVLPSLAAVRITQNGHTVAFALMSITVIYFIVAGGGVPGMGRFRAPVIPLMILMSAFALRPESTSR